MQARLFSKEPKNPAKPDSPLCRRPGNGLALFLRTSSCISPCTCVYDLQASSFCSSVPSIPLRAHRHPWIVWLLHQGRFLRGKQYWSFTVKKQQLKCPAISYFRFFSLLTLLCEHCRQEIWGKTRQSPKFSNWLVKYYLKDTVVFTVR